MFILSKMTRTAMECENFLDTRLSTKWNYPVKVIFSTTSPRERNRLFACTSTPFTLKIVTLKPKLYRNS